MTKWSLIWKPGNSGKSPGWGFLMKRSGKFRKNCQNQGKFNYFADVLENVDIVRFISILSQRLRVINVTFCYTSDKLESGKNIVSQGKVREHENLEIMATLYELSGVDLI